MTTTLDHLVVAGTDVSALVAWWAATSGHQPTKGGSHVGFGTRNALVGLGDSYLELVGPDPDQDEPAQPRPFGIDDLAEHSIQLVTFALAVDDLDDALAQMAANDVAFSQAMPMSRAKPDGSLLEWRLATPVGLDGVMPFLIEWGADTPHPSAALPSGCTLESVAGRHPKAHQLAGALAAIDAPCSIEQNDQAGLSAIVNTPNGQVEL